jgi:hypothetical protein
MLLFLPTLMVEATDFDQAPSTPIIEGPCEAEIGETCFYTVTSTDPQGDDLYYEVRYSDDPSFNIRGGPFKSGEKITFVHCWDDSYQDYNPFVIRVMAVDEYDHESDWGRFEVNMTNAKIGKLKNNDYDGNLLIKIPFLRFLEKQPHLFPLIRQILKL